MNQRLLQFLSAENISQAQFADTIGVARASVSHILAGRNKPGFDFIESMASHFPDLSLEWIISGKGKMYKNRGVETAPETRVITNLPVARQAQEQAPSAAIADSSDILSGTDGAATQAELIFGDGQRSQQPAQAVPQHSAPSSAYATGERRETAVSGPARTSSAFPATDGPSSPQSTPENRRISKIVIFFSDGTYQELR